MENIYKIQNEGKIATPALVYYLDIIRENTKEAIRAAGSAERLWPHVKSHKSADMLDLLISMGIHRFKAATIAECEMAAETSATDIILAYPLVGPNVKRFLALVKRYQDKSFYAIGDDYDAVKVLSDSAAEEGVKVKFLLDINMGMNRTGVPFDKAESLARKIAALPAISFKGMHCYDGHNSSSDYEKRLEEARKADSAIDSVKKGLERAGIETSIMVMGGTPSFTSHARVTPYYLSPGTCFIHDAGYKRNLPDLPFTPGAALMTRVISHPGHGLFTLDLGSKAIATDSSGQKGYIAGLESAVPVSQSEEHWVFRTCGEVPAISTVLYVIPAHICPTTALYSDILISEDGHVTDKWPVSARNRMITL